MYYYIKCYLKLFISHQNILSDKGLEGGIVFEKYERKKTFTAAGTRWINIADQLIDLPHPIVIAVNALFETRPTSLRKPEPLPAPEEEIINKKSGA